MRFLETKIPSPLVLLGCGLALARQDYDQPTQTERHVRVSAEGFSYLCEWHAAVRRLPAPMRLANAFVDCLAVAHAAEKSQSLWDGAGKPG